MFARKEKEQLLLDKRNKIWRLKEKHRPVLNVVLNQKTRKFESHPANVARNIKFVIYNNQLNDIDRQRGISPTSAKLKVNSKGIITQVN